MSDDAKLKLALFLRHDGIKPIHDHGAGLSGTIEIEMVHFNDENNTVLGINSYCKNRVYDNLCLTAQWSASIDANPDYTFAWSAEYRHLYAVDFNDAATMFKTLKRIQGHIDRFPVRPVSFGQYVQLLAKALSVSCLVRQPEPYPNGQPSREFIATRPDEIQYTLDMLIRDARSTATVEQER